MAFVINTDMNKNCFDVDDSDDSNDETSFSPSFSLYFKAVNSMCARATRIYYQMAYKEFKQGINCDVIIYTGKRCVPLMAHKWILLNSSKYFL